MNFIGRKKEIQKLENLYFSKEAFVMLTGRKSIGKSALVKAFSQNKNALYYSCSNVSDLLNRRAFFNSLKNYMEKDDLAADKDLFSWKEMFGVFAEEKRRERKLLIIDNFHFLVQADPDILSLFRNAWNTILRPNYVMVILVMPHSRVLLNLQEKNNALFSVLTHRFKLDRVSFKDLMKEYPHHDFRQLMMLYGIVGGLPKYWNYFKNCVDKKEFMGAVSDFFMNPYGDLLDEPLKLIDGEVDEPEVFHSVLFALANGRKTCHSVEAFTGYKHSVVESVVRYLQDMDLVSQRHSVVERRGFLSKPVDEFGIIDPFIHFWYCFVFPYYEEIKGADDTEAMKNLEAHFDSHINYWFKQGACEVLSIASHNGGVPLKCDTIGTYFNKEIDIDVVGIDEKNQKLFLGDCAFEGEPYNNDRLDSFINKCASLKDLKAFKDYDRYFGIFSTGPFDQSLMNRALVSQNILLFNGITMYSMNN